MELYGVEIPRGGVPQLDPDFVAFEQFVRAYLKGARQPVSIVVTREKGNKSVYDTYLYGTLDMRRADILYLERTVKLLLWARGGFEVALYGDDSAAVLETVCAAYSETGSRAFDCGFMSRVYGQPFKAAWYPLAQKPDAIERPMPVGGHFDGCRIGFDAGGSDRKVSAVIDGEPVFSEEVLWHPKEQADPQYHYDGIVTALKTAAAHLPRVDGIGVSSAGVYVDNYIKVASLFIKVPQDLFDREAQDLYLRAAAEIGDVPVKVANDGDVAALAGAISLGHGRILGIAMGTSEAAGYVDADKNIMGWLNELAFAPVDLSPEAPQDDWSLDFGVGANYLSQESVLRLAPLAGIELTQDTKALKLKEVQQLAEQGDARALSVFESIGCYVGHTAALYRRFYDAGLLLLMGRVTSGAGGERVLETARRVLRECYPDLTDLAIELPDEKSRRVGQSVAAASLPEIGK